jgi:uncharacterized protein YerC
MAKSNNVEMASVLTELTAIKQLLIIALLRDGVQQSHIASALGVSNATINRLFPKDLIKTIKTPRDIEK